MNQNPTGKKVNPKTLAKMRKRASEQKAYNEANRIRPDEPKHLLVRGTK